MSNYELTYKQFKVNNRIIKILKENYFILEPTSYGSKIIEGYCHNEDLSSAVFIKVDIESSTCEFTFKFYATVDFNTLDKIQDLIKVKYRPLEADIKELLKGHILQHI